MVGCSAQKGDFSTAMETSPLARTALVCNHLCLVFIKWKRRDFTVQQNVSLNHNLSDPWHWINNYLQHWNVWVSLPVLWSSVKQLWATPLNSINQDQTWWCPCIEIQRVKMLWMDTVGILKITIPSPGKLLLPRDIIATCKGVLRMQSFLFTSAPGTKILLINIYTTHYTGSDWKFKKI